MLRSIGKQSGESVESVPDKKRKATVGRIYRNEGFKPGMKQYLYCAVKKFANLQHKGTSVWSFVPNSGLTTAQRSSRPVVN